MNIDNIKPVFQSIEKSSKQMTTGSVSYNEAGVSYNEASVEYGGMYGLDGNSPSIGIFDYKANMNIVDYKVI